MYNTTKPRFKHHYHQPKSQKTKAENPEHKHITIHGLK